MVDRADLSMRSFISDSLIFWRGTVKAAEAENARLLAEVKRLEAELARLQDALPTTADGVPVVPAMELWCHQEGWRTPLHFTALAFDSTLLGVWLHGQYILFERSYASEAAARAAKETSDAR